MKLDERDKKLIWHPFTQEKTADLPIAIKKAKGSYIYDEQGTAYLDLISSWWVNLHGHGHPEIAKSIYKQAMLLEHVIFAGFTHEPAVVLCECLKKILPKSLVRFFFSDNGSTAVEIALKMAYQYWYNKGKKHRKLFISFEGGYHGDTFGSMSVGKKSGFHNPFSSLLFDVVTLPYPHTWDDDPTCEIKEQASIKKLKEQLDKNGDKVAAIILEPLVQGASGMRVCRLEFVREVVEIVRSYDILVIFDEVMTGFGRTGTYFASEQIGLDPDFICISKGITGGFLPLALTITTQKVYEAFLDDNCDKAFLHGHSYTANPIACAASIASFKILTSQNTKLSIKNIFQLHKKGIENLRNTHLDKIKNTRIKGTISAFEISSEKNVNEQLKSAFLKKGLLIRPLDNTIYLLPPYSITQEELDNTYKEISKILDKL